MKEYDKEKENVTIKATPTEEDENNKMPMLYFKRDGYLIPLWYVVTIEKDWRFTENSHKVIYTIVINKNMVQSDKIKVGEKEFIFGSEKTRDEQFDTIVELMCEHNDVTTL